jgi:PTS system ascorbate-specific IIC component
MAAMGSPVVLLPAAGIAFFSGGTMGVFGSIRGGLKGAIIASFLGGILLTALPLVLFPAFSELGITDAGFPQIDYNIIGILLDKILKLFS